MILEAPTGWGKSLVMCVLTLSKLLRKPPYAASLPCLRRPSDAILTETGNFQSRARSAGASPLGGAL